MQRGFQAQKFPPLHSFPSLHPFSSRLLRITLPSKLFIEASKKAQTTFGPTFHQGYRTVRYALLLAGGQIYKEISEKPGKGALSAN
jgi:hypothetical protein